MYIYIYIFILFMKAALLESFSGVHSTLNPLAWPLTILPSRCHSSASWKLSDFIWAMLLNIRLPASERGARARSYGRQEMTDDGRDEDGRRTTTKDTRTTSTGGTCTSTEYK